MRCRALPAPLRQCSWPPLPRGPAPSGSVRAGSCSPTTNPSWWQSRRPPWRPFIRGASTWALAGLWGSLRQSGARCAPGNRKRSGSKTDLRQLLDYLAGSAPITARPRNDSATPVFVLANGAGVDIAARAGLGVVLGGPAVFGPDPGRTTAGAGKVPCPVPSVTMVRQALRHDFRERGSGSEPAGSHRELLLPEAVALARSRTTGEFAALAPVGPEEWTGLTARELEAVEGSLSNSVYGTPAEVRSQLERLFTASAADELMVTGGSFNRRRTVGIGPAPGRNLPGGRPGGLPGHRREAAPAPLTRPCGKVLKVALPRSNVTITPQARITLTRERPCLM